MTRNALLAILFVAAAVIVRAVPAAMVAEPGVPVVFIPGFAGSKLVGSDGEVLWGDVTSVLRRLEKLDLRVNPSKVVKPIAVLDSVSVLGPFTVGQYDDLLKTIESLGYQRGRSLVTFPYDWRQSNEVTARQFQNFVDQHPALRGRQFDIVAHSMGGLVALLYIHDRGGAARVRTLVTMGTPYQGSLEAFRTALEGIREINFFAGVDTVRRVFTSFPALFELMPTYRNCCFRSTASARTELAVSSIESWRAFPWARDVGVDLTIAERGLRTAARVNELASTPVPRSLRVFRLAGSGIATLSQVRFTESGEVERWAYRPGDGTVFELSAAPGSLQSAAVSLRRHATIFEDDVVRTWLRRILTERDLTEHFSRPTRRLEVPSSDRMASLPVASVRLSLDRQVVEPDATVAVTLELFDSQDQPLTGAGAQEVMLIGSERDVPVRFTIEQRGDGRFAVSLAAPSRQGVYRMKWEPLPGAAEEQFFYVAAH